MGPTVMHANHKGVYEKGIMVLNGGWPKITFIRTCQCSTLGNSIEDEIQCGKVGFGNFLSLCPKKIGFYGTWSCTK